MGYETHRFEANVEDFECPICCNVLEDPLQIKICEHMFCRQCLAQWFEQATSCPVDRRLIRVSDLSSTSRFFRMQYNRLKIRCKFAESGCVEIVQIENIYNHERSCQYNPSSDDQRGDTQTRSNICVSQKELIETLKDNRRIRSFQVENIMLAVDRSLFCSSDPYEDKPKKINYGATISAPHIHAIILELLKPNLTEGAKVLDIGSGSGYLTICMALMIGTNGRAIGIDHVNHLIFRSRRQIRQHFRYLTTSRVKFLHGDGRLGYSREGPYDVINIGGAVKEIPQSIIDQLKPNGRLIAPVICSGGGGQKLISIHKSSDGEIERAEHMRVRFSVLTDLTAQLN